MGAKQSITTNDNAWPFIGQPIQHVGYGPTIDEAIISLNSCLQFHYKAKLRILETDKSRKYYVDDKTHGVRHFVEFVSRNDYVLCYIA